MITQNYLCTYQITTGLVLIGQLSVSPAHSPFSYRRAHSQIKPIVHFSKHGVALHPNPVKHSQAGRFSGASYLRTSTNENGSALGITHNDGGLCLGSNPALEQAPEVLRPGYLLRFMMPRFKKFKKSYTLSQHPASLGIPTHIAIGPLGFVADLDVDPAGVSRPLELKISSVDSTASGSNGGGGSRISLSEARIRCLRPPALGTTSSVPGNSATSERV